MPSQTERALIIFPMETMKLHTHTFTDTLPPAGHYHLTKTQHRDIPDPFTTGLA